MAANARLPPDCVISHHLRSVSLPAVARALAVDSYIMDPPRRRRLIGVLYVVVTLQKTRQHLTALTNIGL